MPPLSRRSFLTTGAALGVGGALSAPVGNRRARAADSPVPSAARNLIFMVADGMSAGTLQLADLASELERSRPSRWVRLIREGRCVRSLVDTRSASSHVTDSAAAATAWGIGRPVNNGAIGLAPDGSMPEPILITAKNAGKATGLVTTTRITHATPAGFACNIPTNRDDENAIARQMLKRPIDVLLGGGAKFIDPALKDSTFGGHTVRTRDALLTANKKAPDGRLLGVFARSHMAFEMDRSETPEPSLAEMSRVALDRLSQHPGGFVMQIEGGRVDHAAHFNDAAPMVRDQLAFDDAIGVVLDFVEERDDTLVVITTDHACANPGLTDYGDPGIEGFARLLDARHSFQWALAQLAGDFAPARLIEVLAEATGITLTEQELKPFTRWIGGDWHANPFVFALNEDFGPLGAIVALHYRVGFISPNHASDHVELTAVGAATHFIPPFAHLSDFHAVMLNALDIPIKAQR